LSCCEAALICDIVHELEAAPMGQNTKLMGTGMTGALVSHNARACGATWSTRPDRLDWEARLRAYSGVRGLDRTCDLRGCAPEACMSSQNNAISLMQMESTLTCPRCGHQSAEQMPTNACQFFYVCKGCGEKLKPLPGDCRVFCSYGTVPCPPVQTAAHSSARRSSSGKRMVNGLPMPSARPQRLAAQCTARSLRAAITWSAMMDSTLNPRPAGILDGQRA
jgi:hypothetical protein